MIRSECESIEAGMQLLIGEDFVESPHEAIREYLGTVQTVEKVDLSDIGWIYFKDVPQPFAISEVVGIAYNLPCIDDESIPYDVGSIDLIFGEV